MASDKSITPMTEDERRNSAAKEVQAVLDKYQVEITQQLMLVAKKMPIETTEVTEEEKT